MKGMSNWTAFLGWVSIVQQRFFEEEVPKFLEKDISPLLGRNHCEDRQSITQGREVFTILCPWALLGGVQHRPVSKLSLTGGKTVKWLI